MEKINIEKIKELVEIGLRYSVDYTYVLQDIKKLLDGKDVNININHYLDY